MEVGTGANAGECWYVKTTTDDCSEYNVADDATYSLSAGDYDFYKITPVYELILDPLTK